MSIHLQRKYKINNILEKKFKVGDYFSDKDLINRFDNNFDYYKTYGSFHHDTTQDFKILEIYHDNILNNILENLEIILNEDDEEEFIKHIVLLCE